MDFALALNPTGAEPLHRQLTEGWRQAILSGRFPPGARVPSTRALAGSLGLSRATVTRSYEELIAEGYLETVIGSGAYVCRQLPEDLLRPSKAAPRPAEAQPAPLRLSRYAARIADPPPAPTPGGPGMVRFDHWRPDLTRFPAREWARLIARHSGPADPGLLDYADDSFGYPPLREAIADYLARSRAVRCGPGQVIIVNGSQQAIDLVARLFLDPGDEAGIEDPGYLGARRSFLAHGASILGVPVDNEGMLPEALPRRASKRLKLVYVTPSHQFPTGTTLSLPRRLALLDWARRNGVVVIEDDYDSEYRYGSRPVPALQGLGDGGSVIYVGTLSKVLFPALRLGYVVAPAPLARAFARAKWLADRQPPILEQRVLADFIREGHLERHIRRMRKVYGARRTALVDALSGHFGDLVEIAGDSAGMHLMAKLQLDLSDAELLARARRAGVEFVPTSGYYLRRAPGGEFLLGFAAVPERVIRLGVRRLADALLQRGSRTG